MLPYCKLERWAGSMNSSSSTSVDSDGHLSESAPMVKLCITVVVWSSHSLVRIKVFLFLHYLAIQRELFQNEVTLSLWKSPCKLMSSRPGVVSCILIGIFAAYFSAVEIQILRMAKCKKKWYKNLYFGLVKEKRGYFQITTYKAFVR